MTWTRPLPSIAIFRMARLKYVITNPKLATLLNYALSSTSHLNALADFLMTRENPMFGLSVSLSSRFSLDVHHSRRMMASNFLPRRIWRNTGSAAFGATGLEHGRCLLA